MWVEKPKRKGYSYKGRAISVRLPAELRVKLNKAARKRKKSANALVVELIEQLVKELKS